MDKIEIKTRLEASYDAYLKCISELSEKQYEHAPEGKWNAGQQTLHLIKSVKPIAKGLGMPKFLLRRKFGKSNQLSRSYQELVAQYLSDLKDHSGAPPKAYAPGNVSYADAEEMTRKLKGYVLTICMKLARWKEDQLDNYAVPHPLLGTLTLRELLYFTIYHAEHHQQKIERYFK